MGVMLMNMTRVREQTKRLDQLSSTSKVDRFDGRVNPASVSYGSCFCSSELINAYKVWLLPSKLRAERYLYFTSAPHISF